MILHASSPTPRHAFNAHAYTALGMRKCAQDIERGPSIMRFNFERPPMFSQVSFLHDLREPRACHAPNENIY